MAKKSKETEMNLYYMNNGQAKVEDIDDIIKRKRAKEREKRIRENKTKQEEEIEIKTETEIQMTKKNKIKKEEEQIKKITQEEKKKNKRRKRIKSILKIFTLLAIIIGGTVFAMVSPVFNVKEIQVVGNEVVSSETVVSLSELKTGENIFRFLSSDAINKIKTNAYIENVKIHRNIPNVIQIEVIERKHEFSMDFLGKYAYINKQGYILEINEDSKQKIIIQGMKTKEEQVTVGNRLEEYDLERLEDVMKIIQAAKEYNIDNKISSIDISNKNEYNIYLGEDQKRAYLGDNTNLGNKMLYVNSIMEQEKGKAGEIFVNGDLNDGFKAYFRESLNV